MFIRAITLALLLILASSSTTRANDFRDNPLHLIDRTRAPWALPIGELQSTNVIRKASSERVIEAAMVGSGFLVSPCYILTAAHVPFGDDLSPDLGKDYSMEFRAGISVDGAFQGKTVATRVVTGDRDTSGGGDWALMRLKTCIGKRPELGWLEPSQTRLDEAKGRQILTVGYPAALARGYISVGKGVVLGPDARNDLFKISAPVQPGQSGGPVLTIENGSLVVIGLNVAEMGSVHGQTYDRYSDKHANLIGDAAKLLARPYIKAILDADKEEFGAPNPAAERLRMEHLPQ